jgi:hypothetical protein
LDPELRIIPRKSSTTSHLYSVGRECVYHAPVLYGKSWGTLDPILHMRSECSSTQMTWQIIYGGGKRISSTIGHFHRSHYKFSKKPHQMERGNWHGSRTRCSCGRKSAAMRSGIGECRLASSTKIESWNAAHHHQPESANIIKKASIHNTLQARRAASRAYVRATVISVSTCFHIVFATFARLLMS